jgi:PAS domain S-box-containing protein
MFGFGSTTLGITLLALGLLFFLAILVLLRLVPKIRPRQSSPNRNSINSDIPLHNDAVFIIQSGGRVTFINQTARAKFKLWDEEPNLERLARRSRPSDVFWGLCSAAGQAHFTIDGHSVEGTSYFVPNGNDNSVLLSIRSPQSAKQGPDGSSVRNQTFEILTKLSEAMAANLGLETTLEAILNSVDQLIPSDFSEITIWDTKNNWLIPYRFIGVKGIDQRLAKTSERYLPDEGYSGLLISKREPVLISDVDSNRDVRPIIDRNQYPFQSYLGVPLLISDELIGTLELTSMTAGTYTETDIDTIGMLSGQAGIALHNALTYQEEQRRTTELSSLANLTKAVGSVRDFQELFGNLVQGISPLLDVEIAGFLIYDENRRVLDARNPFIGIPPQFVELYQTEIPPESAAESVWINGETIIAPVAVEDQRIIDLGLHHNALAAGVRAMALVPLTSGGRQLGYLQVANKRDGTPFDQADERLLAIIAGQAASIIENANLIKQSVGRALRAESLRRIASLSGSAATLIEIFKYSLLELARLLQADIAGIFLLNENLGELQIHTESLYGFDPTQIPNLLRLSVGDTNFRKTVTASKIPFLTGNVFSDADVIPHLKEIAKPLGAVSAIDVPLVIRDRGLGEIILGSQKEDFFTQSDVQLAATVAGQLAIALERSQLASATDVDLRQRVEQLTAISRIGRELNSSVQLPHLLQLVFDEALQTTNADCGTIMLFEFGETRPKFPKISLQLGDAHGEELTLLERTVLKNGAPLIVSDFANQTEASEIWETPHDGVRSSLIAPIAYQENVVGVIYLHAKSPQRFSAAALDITQSLAVQAAIAIGNAHRYQEQVSRNELLNRRIGTLSNLFDTTQHLHLAQSLEKSLEDIAFGIQTSTPFSTVLISVYDSEKSTLQRITGAGIALDVLDDLRQKPQTWADIQKLIQSEFRFGRSYYIPHDQRPMMPIGFNSVTLGSEKNGSSGNWHPEDILIIPMVKPNGDPIGLISVDVPVDNLRPDIPTIETLEIFASQASLIIESQQQLRSLENQNETLTTKLDDFRAAYEELPEMVEKVQLQDLVIADLSRASKRINAGLEIVENLNKQTNRSTILETICQGLISKMGFDIVLVAEPSNGTPQLINIWGAVPPDTNPEALFGQRNPLHKSLADAEILLISDLENNQHWNKSPLLGALNSKSLISFPISTGSGIDAAILAISQQVLPEFINDDETIFRLISHQSAVAINNLNLMTETGYRLLEVNLLLDFSRRLGSLDPTRILRILVESAMQVSQPAQAGMVAIFDPGLNLLVPQAASRYQNNEAMLEIEYHPEGTLVGDVFTDGEPVRIDEIDFARHYALDADNLLKYREATGGILPISSLVLPLQSGDIKLGVLVLDNFQEAAAFSDEDKALIASLTQQTALTLENARLYQAAEERAAQLEALSEVAATIASSLEPEALIQSLLDSLEDIVPFETGTLWLRDEKTLTIQSARGFENTSDLIGLSTTTEDSRLFSEMITTNRFISVGDVRIDARFPGFELERLSWLGVPLIAKGELIGVIALEKTEANFYTEESIQVATTFASQAAVALENANLYQQSLQRTSELDDRSQRLALLNRFSNQISSVLDSNYVLQTTMQELQHALPSSQVSSVMWIDGQPVLQAEVPPLQDNLPQALPRTPIFERLQQSLGIFNTSNIHEESELAPLADFFSVRKTTALLILPLVTGDLLHGFIFVQNDQSYHYSADEIGLARIITNQAAVAIQNATSFAETTRLTAELEQRVAVRTDELAQEHNRAQSLLMVMRELSASLDLDQVLNRTLSKLNDTVGAEKSLVLLARPDDSTFFLRATTGIEPPLPRGGQATFIELEAGLPGWVINNRQATFIDEVNLDDRWVAFDELPIDSQSIIGVPLMLGPEALGAIFLFHGDISAFTLEDQELVQAAAMQMAVAINNTELFNLIRDQAESMGTMLRSQQVEASRSRGILEAVADGVLVTDPNNEITLFNLSAQQILNLASNEVLGHSLDDFMGLFGNAAQTWMNTIRKWSDNPTSYETGETYAERITLDDRRVVSIHLAPVVMGSEFLGTVSIFRDITHQVEVDRLKSEFVATVSHELRTPMTSIKGYVDVMLMGAAGELSDQQIGFLNIVKGNAERLNILVNDLLDVSRIEAGKVELSIQPLEIRAIIEGIVADQKRQAEEDGKAMAMTIDVADNIPRISGDEERVRQILSNLVSNAYLYTPDGGQITISSYVQDEDVLIAVKDNGIGIPPEEQDRIFERFYRGENPLVLASSGTGLGLAIVMQLIQMHHGHLWFESSGILGEGSAFYVTLPLNFINDPEV